MEAKFAFNQGCRWMRTIFDFHQNFLFNERMMFVLANDRGIKRNDDKPCARVFIPRDAHTGATDGEGVYFYVNDCNTFMDVFYRMKNISPVLSVG